MWEALMLVVLVGIIATVSLILLAWSDLTTQLRHLRAVLRIPPVDQLTSPPPDSWAVSDREQAMIERDLLQESASRAQRRSMTSLRDSTSPTAFLRDGKSPTPASGKSLRDASWLELGPS